MKKIFMKSYLVSVWIIFRELNFNGNNLVNSSCLFNLIYSYSLNYFFSSYTGFTKPSESLRYCPFLPNRTTGTIWSRCCNVPFLGARGNKNSGAAISIGREIRCVPFAGCLCVSLENAVPCKQWQDKKGK